MSKLLYTKDYDQKYKLVVEQLEVCSKLIKSGSPNKDRMAIILLDNLVDILMLRYCNYKFSEDSFFSLYEKPKYTKEQIKKAKENISGKVEILRNNSKSILTKKDEAIISICHSYRNSAQHKDEHNPQMTNAIARILFVTTSNLFVKIQHKGHAVYYSEPPKWLKKYTNETKLEYKDFAAKFVKKLQKNISIGLPELKRTILSDFNLRINNIDEMIAELPFKKAKDFSYMLKMFEYQRSEEYKSLGTNNYDAKYRIESNSVTYHDNFLKSVEKDKDKILRENYKPNVTYKTYLEIKRDYKNISKDKKIYSTLKLYEKFSRPLETLESLFDEALDQWYRWQDLLDDIARGK